jgi:hypothetical protein
MIFFILSSDGIGRPLSAAGSERLPTQPPPPNSPSAPLALLSTQLPTSAADSAIDAAAPLQSSENPTPAAADAAAPALALKLQDRAAQDLDADESWTPPFRVDFEVCTNY